jgi:hypothetical protein
MVKWRFGKGKLLPRSYLFIIPVSGNHLLVEKRKLHWQWERAEK